MTIYEAIQERHSVRIFRKDPIPDDVLKLLNQRIKELNSEYDVELALVTSNTKVINTAYKYTFTKNADNCIVLTGKNRPGIDEVIGYVGCDIMLYAQTLGLNTCWMSGSINKGEARDAARAKPGYLIPGIVVIGYGENQGKPHRSKEYKDVARYIGEAPYWFYKGVGCVLLAPTANNKQAFNIKGDAGKVRITCDNGSYSGLELGIAKYHFEAGAGKDNFTWA
ncbi:MAG: nitroreductase [Saccharofermentans sp.]|nr:nitroreductase [Saccharofermentans sp.]